MSQMLQEDGIDEDEANEKIGDIERSCDDHKGKVATRIVSSHLNRFLNLSSSKECESDLIIENLRPFISYCITSPYKGVKFEWMIYRMASFSNDGQLMKQAFVVYVNFISIINFELLIIEVKKTWQLW